jgi:hypothetical protein
MYQTPDSPLSIGGVLDDGFRLLKASFTRVFLLALVASVLGQIPSLFVEMPVDGSEIPDITAVVFGVSLLTGAMTLVFYAAIIVRINAIACGLDVTMADAVGVGFKRFFPMLLAYIIYGLCVAGGMLALVIPGFILILSLMFAPYLVIIDELSALDAIKQSHKLVWGYWWRTAGIFTVIMFLVFAVYFLLALLMAPFALLEVSATDIVSILQFILVPLITAVILPVLYAAGLAILNDLKLRRQGEDLAARMEGLENA